MKMLIDLWMDGYETEEDHKKACIALVEEQLDFAGSSVKILEVEGEKVKEDGK